MIFKLGLTGSIGMGKSTTAGFFRELGCDVWDADAAVHRLYSKNGGAVGPISAVFPDVLENEMVSREKLRDALMADPTKFPALERIIHPLVAKDRHNFIESAKSDIVVLDIPLLFETGAEKAMDAIACVSVSADQQKKRVLDRGTMNVAAFEKILSRQWPNAEKEAKSDYVIKTDTFESAKAQVSKIVDEIRKSQNA
ncbi:MAG: dephospho-CoA kinase [Flavobacteriaceae bacterium]|nr:dephospho-CoA kinase [Flavobacteriaceae bacterium]